MEYKELIKLFNISKNDIVFFCSDIIKLIIYYKSIKKEFSPNNFIDSIIDEIGKGGTLIFPTYNWGFCQGTLDYVLPTCIFRFPVSSVLFFGDPVLQDV